MFKKEAPIMPPQASLSGSLSSLLLIRTEWKETAEHTGYITGGMKRSAWVKCFRIKTVKGTWLLGLPIPDHHMWLRQPTG